MRYRYLGDRLTDRRLVGQPCDPVRRSDGKCIVGKSKETAEIFLDFLLGKVKTGA